MGTQILCIAPLENVLVRLVEGHARFLTDVSDIQIRDGLVQRYKFTYEVSHNMLKRYLEMSSPNPEIFDSMAFADLIRSANEQGLLLSDWTQWKTFREMRAKTSHTYEEAIALEVVSIIPAFILEAKALLQQLQTRNT